MQITPAADVPKTTGKTMDAWTYLREHMPLFAGMNEETLGDLADDAELLKFKAGQTVIFKGASVDGLYIVLSGKVGIYGKAPDHTTVRFTELGAGEVFGEMSIVEWGCAGASVKAESDLLALLIPRESFRRILALDACFAVRVNDLIVSRRSSMPSLLA